MDQVDYEAYKEKIDLLTVQNKQLRRTNIRQKRKIKQLQYTIRKMKRESEEQNKKKQHYRNGRKRGSMADMDKKTNRRDSNENAPCTLYPSEWRKRNYRGDSLQRIPCGKGSQRTD